MRNGAEAAGLRERATPGNSSYAKKQAAIPFSLLLAYLFLEYGRPQEILTFLRVLHLPGVTIALLTASMVAFGKFRLKGRQSTLFVFLLVLMVIHGPIATNNYWALMIFIAMAMNFVVFLALTHLVDQPEKYDRLIKVWLGVHVFLSIIGIVKQGRGIGGFLNDENDFCLAMNMVIPLSFFLAMNEAGKKRIYFLVVTSLFLFVIILTGSRGGFVGLCVSMLYCWLKTKRKILTALIMGLLAVIAVLVAPSSYWDEVRSIAEQGASKGTGAERMYTWGVGWHMFLDNPVMGVGQGNFPYVFRKYEVDAGHGEEGYHGRSVAGRAAHSIYFTMLPELGIVGTVIILIMVFHMFKDLKTIKSRSGDTGPRKNRRPDPLSSRNYALALGLEGGLISFLVSGAFLSVLYYPNVWVLMGFIVSLKTISSQETDPSAA